MRRWRLPTTPGSVGPGAAGVTLRLGDFSETIPAAQLRRRGGRDAARWTFRSTARGVSRLTLRRAGDRWAVTARVGGLDPARLTGAVRTVVSLDGRVATSVVRVRRAPGAGLRFVLDPDADDDGDGASPNEGDCDDTRPEIHPGAREVPVAPAGRAPADWPIPSPSHRFWRIRPHMLRMPANDS